MERRWWLVLAGLVGVSAAVGALAEPWSGLASWFGDEPGDRAWAHVAVAFFAFAALVLLCHLGVTGVPRALKAFGIELGSTSTPTDRAVSDVQKTLQMNIDHVHLLGDYLRQVRQNGESDRDAIHQRLDAMGLRMNELAQRLSELSATGTASVAAGQVSPDVSDDHVGLDQ